MIVDSSAIAAILFGEPERETFVGALRRAGGAEMSTASYVEIAAVVDGRRDPALSRELDALLDQLRVSVVDLTTQQARIAREAYRDFGRGSGHRARLNLGDCYSYALATSRRDPLLFKGDNFIHTDVRTVDLS